MKTAVIQYRDLERWDVKSLSVLKWNWDEKDIRRIGNILRQKKEIYSSEEIPQMLSIHFGGTMSERPKEKLKGRLFLAKAGNIVFSKIDVRNGAIGIIPDKYPLVAFTSEFPIYEAADKEVDLNYLGLVFRTPIFLERLQALVSGASGRKRIAPEQFENLEIPLPSLTTQRKIIADFEKAKQKSEDLKQKADEKEKRIDEFLLKELGIEKIEQKKRKGGFVVNFKDLERWDAYFNQDEFKYLSEKLDSCKTELLGDCSFFICRPWYPSDFPEGKFNYIQISDVSKRKGIFNCSSVNVEDAPSRATQIVKEGDLIISTTRPYLAAFSKVSKNFSGCIVSSGFVVIHKTSDKLSKDFLILFLQSYAGIEQLKQRMTGGMYPAITQDELEKIKIPLPPLSKQQEIVKKIDMMREEIGKLRAESDELIERAKRELHAQILGK